ncbi:MAG: sel1 repeat family protein [Nitrospina sp.]|nr:sel1 repeat family protein [Nitrospina sp.]
MVCCYGGQFCTWVFGSVHCSRIIIKKMKHMNKQLTFLLSLTFLISFSGSVYGNEYNEALNEWKLAAEQGKVKVQYNLGVMYALGQGVTKNDKESNKWYRLASEQGDAFAQFKLGGMYLMGKGVLQDSEAARKLMRL